MVSVGQVQVPQKALQTTQVSVNHHLHLKSIIGISDSQMKKIHDWDIHMSVSGVGGDAYKNKIKKL